MTMKPPVGALTRDEAVALAKVKGSIIYKVYSGIYTYRPGHISKMQVRGFDGSKILSSIRNKDGNETGTALSWWYEDNYGYLFSNYFHALAYSEKLKAGTTHEQANQAGDVAKRQPA
jgi:hypothetical protein